MDKLTELDEFVASLTPVQRDVIEKIGAAGPNGLSTYGWAINWFSALLMSKKHPGLIETGMDDRHAKLGPLGQKALKALRAQNTPE